MGGSQRRKKFGAEFSEVHLATGPRYEACADTTLQRADQLTDPTLGDEQPFSGATEVQFFSEYEEALDLTHRKFRHISLRSATRSRTPSLLIDELG
ncbi:hypothetical protein GCM10020255_036330 [Rhodococcus baikonurensis]